MLMTISRLESMATHDDATKNLRGKARIIRLATADTALADISVTDTAVDSGIDNEIGSLLVDTDLRQLRNAAGSFLAIGDKHTFHLIADLVDELYHEHYLPLS